MNQGIDDTYGGSWLKTDQILSRIRDTADGLWPEVSETRMAQRLTQFCGRGTAGVLQVDLRS